MWPHADLKRGKARVTAGGGVGSGGGGDGGGRGGGLAGGHGVNGKQFGEVAADNGSYNGGRVVQAGARDLCASSSSSSGLARFNRKDALLDLCKDANMRGIEEMLAGGSVKYDAVKIKAKEVTPPLTLNPKPYTPNPKPSTPTPKP